MFAGKGLGLINKYIQQTASDFKRLQETLAESQ